MIQAQILGAEQLQRRLEALGPKLQVELKKSVTKLCLEITRRVKQDKLSGQVLKVKTGQLRRSISFKVTDGPDGPKGTVGSNASYAKAHEFGFAGSVSVKAHMRLIKKAWGKPINPTQVSVGPYTRKVKLPERSFLRSAIAEMDSDIREELIEAVKRAVKP